MKNIKILAVDDDNTVLDKIKIMCPDFNITTESHPLVALERLRREKFDIFIIDYQMPVLNGIELLEEIKKLYTPWIYIALLSTAFGTTYLFKEEKEENLFSYFIEKPITETHLKKVMEKSIEMLDKKKELRWLRSEEFSVR